MATAAVTKARPAGRETSRPPRRPSSSRRRRRDRSPFLYVVMMPIVIAATLGVIAFYLTLPLR